MSADALAGLRSRAARIQARIAFPEGEDPRVLAAADRLAREKLARPVVLGREAVVREVARQGGLGLLGVKVMDPAREVTAARVERFQMDIGEADPAVVRERMAGTVGLAAFLVRSGEADAGVGGAVHTTAEILRAGIKIVGLRPGVKTVSSFFLMEIPGSPPRVLFFADCGVVPEPTASQLADIAVTTADSFELLTGDVPRTAFLAFSTRGSAEHPSLGLIREALSLARERAPGRAFDGELQVDSALVPEVAEHKSPGSEVAGRANVLIFPDLHSGNIGYKLVERLAGARALGPIVQGLQRPFCDLSRGASTADVFNVAVIAAVLSERA